LPTAQRVRGRRASSAPRRKIMSRGRATVVDGAGVAGSSYLAAAARSCWSATIVRAIPAGGVDVLGRLLRGVVGPSRRVALGLRPFAQILSGNRNSPYDFDLFDRLWAAFLAIELLAPASPRFRPKATAAALLPSSVRFLDFPSCEPHDVNRIRYHVAWAPVSGWCSQDTSAERTISALAGRNPQWQNPNHGLRFALPCLLLKADGDTG
jgi:hypothetical protein